MGRFYCTYLLQNLYPTNNHFYSYRCGFAWYACFARIEILKYYSFPIYRKLFFCFCQLNILPSKLLYPTKTCYIVVKPNQTAICTTINIIKRSPLGESKSGLIRQVTS
jgi:hypothetical protein